VRIRPAAVLLDLLASALDGTGAVWTLKLLSLRNFTSGFAIFAVLLVFMSYRKVRKGFRKERKSKLHHYRTRPLY
jgi:hypothetical protein